MIGGQNNPPPLRRVAKGKALRSSRKASKRIYDTATMVGAVPRESAQRFERWY
jgi:hypothetical protein